MNPQFARTKADKNAIRSEYIKNLQLETSNNLMNYNANQIFKQTGALPPSITAQIDTRSITEKYADKQKARVAVIAGLREITDGANANMISDQIHGDEIITLLNNLPQIVADIKPKWSLGITAPAFMNYWNKYKLSLQANAGVSNFPILQSNQLLTNITGLLQTIQSTLPTKDDLIKLKSVMGDLPSTRLRQQGIEDILRAMKVEDIIRSSVKELEQEKIPEIIEQKRQILGELIRSIPNKEQIEQSINDFEIAKSLGKDQKGIERLEGQLIESFSEIPDDAELVKLREEMSILSAKTTPANTPSQSQSATEATEIPNWGVSETDLGSEEGSDTEGMTTAPAKSPSPFRPTSFQELMNGDWTHFAKPYIMGLIKSGDIKKSDINYDPVTFKAEKRPSSLTKGNIRETNLPELIDDYLTKKPSGETGRGLKRQMKGCGVAPKGTISNYARVDTSKKVEKVPSYIQFGKHLLHQHDLHGGILKIKRLSGSIINELPTQSIGGKLKKVLITLTGTGSPSFEDINELNEHEKSLLNKIVKNCKIDQRLLVPTPDKTKEEQLYNRLQILSGEINAGNNNPQIVRELKTLLLKLKNSGRIPARHAHVILEELLSLGY